MSVELLEELGHQGLLPVEVIQEFRYNSLLEKLGLLSTEALPSVKCQELGKVSLCQVPHSAKDVLLSVRRSVKISTR